jgi:molybdate transport system ATP-binding protein
MIEINIRKTLLGATGSMELDVDLMIKEHAFVALAGKSGSGKTTLLRILAGLESAEGKIKVDDMLWQDAKKVLPSQKRGIGFVFQDYALFANMSVEQNLLYVCKDETLADELLHMTELTALKDRLPSSLSGGQQQRVSLCRAMMNRPKLLLMDEPLSALDPEMRSKLQHDILNLHKTFGTTTVMVSHDPSEIYRLADYMLVLDAGQVVKEGTPKEVMLKTQGSQKFSLRGELLDIIKADVIYIGVVSIGQQIVEVVMDSEEAKQFSVGESVLISTKAFSPTISKLMLA